MNASLLFLGTGASMGSPIITCRCQVCVSTNPKNQRLRPAALLRVGGKQILIDAGPDIRTQMLRANITDLSGILITHTHFDHIAGIDDLRVFYFLHHRRIPCLVSDTTMREIQLHYPYFFSGPDDDVMGGSRFTFQVLEKDFGTTSFCGLNWQTVTYEQNGMKVTGFRLGNLAYILDIRHPSKEVIEALSGVEVLVLSALRYTESRAHFSLDEAVAFARQVGAKKTWFSHIAHEVDHEEGNHRLPPDIRLAYDGLEVPFHVENH